MRSRITMLAAFVTIVGGLQLVTPRTALADKEACCDAIGADCCGDRCKVTADGHCLECNGFWGCLFF